MQRQGITKLTGSFMMCFSLFSSPPVHERIEWLAFQAGLYEAGARYEVPAHMIEENVDVLEFWQRDHIRSQKLMRYHNDRRFFHEIWRELSLHDFWLLCTLIYSLDTEYIQLTKEKSTVLAGKLASWLHDQKKWITLEPDYKPNQLLVISWRHLYEFLANQDNLSYGQQQFLVALSQDESDLMMLELLHKDHPMDLIGDGARSNYVVAHRQEQRRLHLILSEFYKSASYIHPFLKNEIHMLRVYDAWLLWFREKIGINCMASCDRYTYYGDIPQELSKKAIRKLASPRIIAIRPGGRIPVLRTMAVPSSLRHVVTLPMIDAWIQEFADEMINHRVIYNMEDLITSKTIQKDNDI